MIHWLITIIALVAKNFAVQSQLWGLEQVTRGLDSWNGKNHFNDPPCTVMKCWCPYKTQAKFLGTYSTTSVTPSATTGFQHDSIPHGRRFCCMMASSAGSTSRLTGGECWAVPLCNSIGKLASSPWPLLGTELTETGPNRKWSGPSQAHSSDDSLWFTHRTAAGRTAQCNARDKNELRCQSMWSYQN
jgi:hypothetical protein